MENITLTYEELAERLGIGVDSARIKARRMRRHGWQILSPNGPGGRAHVVVPEGALPSATPKRSPSAPRTEDSTSGERYVEALGERDKALEERDQARAEAAVLREDITKLRERVAYLEGKTEERDKRLDELKELLAEARRPFWRRWLDK